MKIATFSVISLLILYTEYALALSVNVKTQTSPTNEVRNQGQNHPSNVHPKDTIHRQTLPVGLTKLEKRMNMKGLMAFFMGRYAVENPQNIIGKGATGELFIAKDLENNRQVAIKIIGSGRKSALAHNEINILKKLNSMDTGDTS
jgi:hypothetical protein